MFKKLSRQGKLCKLFLLSAIVLLLGLTGFGEEEIGRARLELCKKYKAYCSLITLQSDLVQVELKLSPAQAISVRQLRRNFDIDVKQIAEEYGQLTAEQQSEDRISDRISDAATKTYQPKIDKILSSEQAVRLDEIYWQLSGVDAFREAEVLKALEVSEIQRKQIGKIIHNLDHPPSDESLEGRIRNKIGLQVDYDKRDKTALKNVLKQLTNEQRTLMEIQWGEPIDQKVVFEQRYPWRIEYQYNGWGEDGKRGLCKGSMQ